MVWAGRTATASVGRRTLQGLLGPLVAEDIVDDGVMCRPVGVPVPRPVRPPRRPRRSPRRACRLTAPAPGPARGHACDRRRRHDRRATSRRARLLAWRRRSASETRQRAAAVPRPAASALARVRRCLVARINASQAPSARSATRDGRRELRQSGHDGSRARASPAGAPRGRSAWRHGRPGEERGHDRADPARAQDHRSASRPRSYGSSADLAMAAAADPATVRLRYSGSARASAAARM